MTILNKNKGKNHWLLKLNKLFLNIAILTIIPFLFQTLPLLALDLQIGIVQRFGEELEDEITLTSIGEDNLKLTFTDNLTGENKSLTTKQLKLDIIPQPLPHKYIEERLILGDHGTFETAEDDANNWRELGIDVEITQPGRWQVWAKRGTYNTPFFETIIIRTVTRSRL